MPYFATEENEVPSNMRRRYMRTEARLDDNGHLVAFTRTWTTQPWIGFTGGVDVWLVASDDTLVDHSGIRQFGVDGFRIPFRKSSLEHTWEHTFSPEAMSRTASILIRHTHAPKDRFDAIVDEAINTGLKVAEVVNRIGGLVASVA